MSGPVAKNSETKSAAGAGTPAQTPRMVPVVSIKKVPVPMHPNRMGGGPVFILDVNDPAVYQQQNQQQTRVGGKGSQSRLQTTPYMPYIPPQTKAAHMFQERNRLRQGIAAQNQRFVASAMKQLPEIKDVKAAGAGGPAPPSSSAPAPAASVINTPKDKMESLGHELTNNYAHLGYFDGYGCPRKAGDYMRVNLSWDSTNAANAAKTGGDDMDEFFGTSLDPAENPETWFAGGSSRKKGRSKSSKALERHLSHLKDGGNRSSAGKKSGSAVKTAGKSNKSKGTKKK
jgi:hypothetical protein